MFREIVVGSFGTNPFQSSRSLSQIRTVPSACDVRKRFDRFSGSAEEERDGVEGREDVSEWFEAGGNHEIEVTGEEVMTPDLFRRVYLAVSGSARRRLSVSSRG